MARRMTNREKIQKMAEEAAARAKESELRALGYLE